jgi:flagellar hook assembly protein FlgD
VRTYTGSGTTWNVIWDGKDGSGVDQPNGTYNYQLQTGTSAIAKGLTIVDRNRALTMTGPATAPAYFSPNGDAIQDTALTASTFNFDDVAWTLTIKNSGGTTVRTVTGTSGGVSFAWDGKNGGGTIQADGPYTITVAGVDGTASVNGSSATTLDRTLPIATITAPASGATLSNVYQSGSPAVGIVGTASDTNVDHWNLECLSFSMIATGTTSVTGATLGTWATLDRNNGSYTLKLQVWDKAGNTTSTSIPVTLGNFRVSANTTEFNAGTGGTVTYTSIVPFTLTETLSIKDAAGQTVRTLVNGASRTAASYPDAWNGKNGSNALLPDGPYFYVASVTAGSYSMTWDLTNTFINDGCKGHMYPGTAPLIRSTTSPR